MKKYLIFTILLISSFYFTDKLVLFLENKNPLMEEIVNSEKLFNTKPVNALIEDNTIIPGISGKEINKHKSLVKMEEYNIFNETYLVYNDIKPEISIDNNKDKIIIKGNTTNRNITLILEDNPKLEDYLNNLNINYNIITKLNTNLKINREYLNGEIDEKNFSDLESLLNKNKINKKICLLNYSNYNSCLKKKYYIVKESLNSNIGIINIINNLNSGDIILLNKQTKLDDLKLILQEINRLDLNIVYLSEMIKE